MNFSPNRAQPWPEVEYLDVADGIPITNTTGQFRLQALLNAATNMQVTLIPSQSTTNIAAAANERHNRLPIMSLNPPQPRSLGSMLQLAAAVHRARRNGVSAEALPLPYSRNTVPASISLSSRLANERIGPLGRLNKMRLMGAIIEGVEVLQAEHQFCEFLNRRLTEYHRQHPAELEPLHYGDEEEAAFAGISLTRLRFAQAISYLDDHVREDMEVYQIAEDCLRKFCVQRTMLANRAEESQAKFYQLLDKLQQDDSCLDIKELLRGELHGYYAMKHFVCKARKDLVLLPPSQENYDMNMKNTKHLIAKLCLTVPVQMPPKVRWLIIRNEALADVSESINNDLAAMHAELTKQKQLILNAQREERERACGRLVELRIIKLPRREEPLCPPPVEPPPLLDDSDSDSDSDSISSSADFRTVLNNNDDERREDFIHTIRYLDALVRARDAAAAAAAANANEASTSAAAAAATAAVNVAPANDAAAASSPAGPSTDNNNGERVVTFNEDVVVLQY